MGLWSHKKNVYMKRKTVEKHTYNRTIPDPESEERKKNKNV